MNSSDLPLVQVTRGPAGRDGRDGRDGLDGVAGAPGPTGAQGTKGMDGLQGKDGRDGIDGKDGAPGVDGKDGRDGIDGKDGADGRDGVGIKGKDGARGEAGPIGPPGPIGPMPQHEWEGTKLRFEIRPGRWGQSVDLQGPAGKGARAQGGGGGGAGTAGAAGVGVPVGGTTGQVLAKASGSNYDTVWSDASPGGEGGSGITKIASGTVSSPVEYFDIALPAGYFSFLLVLNEYICADGTNSWAFSLDGGVSFVCATDAYIIAITSFRTSGAADTETQFGYKSALPSLVDDVGPEGVLGDFGFSVEAVITPGSASTYPVVRADSLYQYSAGVDLQNVRSRFTLNPAAEPAVAKARMTHIRLLPFGNGDMPPTSADTMTVGSYVLYGHSIA